MKRITLLLLAPDRAVGVRMRIGPRRPAGRSARRMDTGVDPDAWALRARRRVPDGPARDETRDRIRLRDPWSRR